MNAANPIDIFISYRRTDTKAISRLVYEELCGRFGREHVFFDVDRIPLGAEYQRQLAEQVARCDVLLVVIGDRWSEGPRAFADDDLVRIEVRAALEAGIPILPILAEGAVLPSTADTLDIVQPLLRCEALPVDSGRDFSRHMTAVGGMLEQLARDYRNERFERQDGHSDFPRALSHAPVATRTLTPIDKRAAGSGGLRWFVGLIAFGAAAAVAFSIARFTARSTAPSSASAPVAPVASAPAEKAAPVAPSFQVSASPAEATLYLDGDALPSNPYVGRLAPDGSQHLIRAEAPGYVSTSRTFVANREVAIILTLARAGEPPHHEAKKARPPVVAPPAASLTAEPTTTDDCKMSPYYVDSRGIKVVKPECLRVLQSP